MRLLSLELHNLRSHADTAVELSGISCASVVGANGAGKSTLLTAIRFALFGQTHGVDELLSHDAAKGHVALAFEQDGKRWKITRGRERGKSSWLVIAKPSGEKWSTLPTHTLAQAQAKLDEILGMSEAVFTASAFSPQGEAGMLAKLVPGQRKALLGEMLGLDRYEAYREQAGERRRFVEKRLAVVEDRVDRLTRELTASAVDDEQLSEQEGLVARAEQAVADAEGELERAQERVRDRERFRLRERLSAEIDAIVETGRLLKSRREDLDRLRSSAIAVDPLRERVDHLLAEQAAAESQLAEIRTRRENLRESHFRAQRLYDSLSAKIGNTENELHRREALAEQAAGRMQRVVLDERCDRCGQRLGAEFLDSTIRAIKAELDDANQALDQTRAELAQVQFERERAEAPMHEARAALEASPLPASSFDPAELTTASRHLESAVKIASMIEAIETGLDLEPKPFELRERWEKLREERDALPANAPEGPEPAFAQRVLRVRQTELADAKAELRTLVERRERHKALRQELDGELLSSKADVERKNALAVLERAFSRNGIPAALLDGAVVAVEQAANETLERLGSSFHVRLDTQRQKKGGGVAETLDIVVDDGQSERRIETFSGGEQMRVFLALRLGLGEALGRRSMDLLVIDELTDLDDAGVGNLTAMLKYLPERQILVVSHQPEVADALPQRLSVTRESPLAPSRVTVSL